MKILQYKISNSNTSLFLSFSRVFSHQHFMHVYTSYPEARAQRSGGRPTKNCRLCKGGNMKLCIAIPYKRVACKSFDPKLETVYAGRRVHNGGV